MFLSDVFLKKTLEYLNFDPNDIGIKCCGINFHSSKLLSHNLRIQKHCRLTILYDMSTFFKPPSLCSLQVVSCLIFGVESFQRKDFCIFSNSLTALWGILVKRARKTIFNIANVLNITILPSNVRFIILHKFSTPCIFEML